MNQIRTKPIGFPDRASMQILIVNLPPLSHLSMTFQI